ncbi:nuclear transport factor 2 family protein [Candidatus Bathyarchaeota archaeon]|nr:nuclear transport factor 2 family protein [Candidatus Bathyarchaeota archaeon]
MGTGTPQNRRRRTGETHAPRLHNNQTRWNKKTALASYVPGKRDWEEAGSSEHHIRIYGDTAIVIGLWRAKGVNKGKSFDYSTRYTSVWVKEGNRLRMISDQSTEIP